MSSCWHVRIWFDMMRTRGYMGCYINSIRQLPKRVLWSNSIWMRLSLCGFTVSTSFFRGAKLQHRKRPLTPMGEFQIIYVNTLPSSEERLTPLHGCGPCMVTSSQRDSVERGGDEWPCIEQAELIQQPELSGPPPRQSRSTSRVKSCWRYVPLIWRDERGTLSLNLLLLSNP